MVKGRIKISIIVAVWLTLTEIWNIVAVFTDIHHVTTFSYMALAIFWTISLLREIAEPNIKRYLLVGGGMLALLFVLRFFRYLDMPVDGIDRMLWYAYYIPILSLPMLSFVASIGIGGADQSGSAGAGGIWGFVNRRDLRRNRKVSIFLFAFAVILAILCLTNDLHGTVMKINYTDTGYSTSYRFVYYIIFVWSALMSVAAFIVMVNRCRVSSYKKYIALPIVVESVGLLLWIWYYIRGGSSPKIMGISLYNIQEVLLLQFIGMWESCILIGLIPSRSLISGKDWIRMNVADTIRDEYKSAKTYYDGLWEKDEDEFREGLIHMTCLGAYAKRRTNLELIADSRGTLSTTELSLAIRETFDYHQLAGLSVGYEESGKAEVPALLIIYAYELFEKIVSQAVSACYVKVYAGQTAEEADFKMIVEADLPDLQGEDGKSFQGRVIRDMGSPEDLGAVLNIYEEDDTEVVELSAAYSLKSPFILNLGKSEKYVEHGLAGIAGFLSLEEEALIVKTWIHDSLGRSLLMTKRYILCPGEVEREALFKTWNLSFGGIVDLIKEGKEDFGSIQPPNIIPKGAETHQEDASIESLDQEDLRIAYRECFSQAGAMGVNVIVKGRIPLDPRYLDIIDTAISVHVTNVAGHTTGNEAYITVTEDADFYTFVFENNGESRSVEVRETGGLRNVRRRVESAGGSMVIENRPAFRMTIKFVR